LLYGRIAEEVGFDFLTISDHFHPWISRQGHSPLVWSVLGGLSVKTEAIPILTAVVGGFVVAGFDHVFIHQVGPRQEEFLEFAKADLLAAIDDQLGRNDATVPAGTGTSSDPR